MVTSSHEAMHRFFRDSPQTLTRLLDTADFPGFPAIASAKRLPEDSTNFKVMERRVDTVLALTATDGRQFVLACEAQGGHSKVTVQNKRRNWPYYLAHLHEEYKLPVVLVVLCQERITVKWAQEPINIGLDFWPTMTVNPLVLGPHNIPMPRAPFTQERLAETVFGVMMHAHDDTVGAILEGVAKALKRADPAVGVEFAMAISFALNSRPAETQWMDLMKAMNMDKELKASLREGSVGELVREIQAENEAKRVLQVLDKRGIALTVEERERILGCTDLETVNRWFDAALDATRADEIFG